MRIAFLSNANSVHLKEWAEYFAGTLGHEVIVLTIPEPEMRYGEGVDVVHVGKRLTARKAAWPFLVPSLRRTLRARAPDILVAYRVVSYGFLAALTGFRPIVMVAQGGDMVWPPGDRLGTFCVRFACKRGDLFNAWSENIREEMVRHGADPARIVVCSRGIDLSQFQKSPNKPKDVFRIAMTRSLQPSYNTIQLVEAIALLKEKIPNVSAEIAGDGSERVALERRARELGVLGDSVRFLGRQSRREVVDLLEGSHVYCSTTITDGLPLSHFEAMAAGCFPVCTDIKANRLWIRPGNNGLLVPVGDPAALAQALMVAFQDERLRAEAARENRRLVEERFDRRVNMKTIEASWKSLLGQSEGLSV